ncbi:hypothetical protein KKF81_06590 [Candidatus Micrarchaeota archaeon]|nr:hypothetical protein [Candidatus Micrarchaeota archaeon]MBU1166596.1 hypothetical protein [Candidatus Micrarchaeota archaeon]MBU1887272.1 hypothetical protein [Candidatus Micrarchaeota archaeon]
MKDYIIVIVCFGLLFVSSMGCTASQNSETTLPDETSQYETTNSQVDNSTTSSQVGSLGEGDVLDAILSLPETQEFIRLVEASGENTSVFGTVDVTGEQWGAFKDRCYLVAIGENCQSYVVTWQTFLVNKETGEILVVDDVDGGSVVGLDEWRKDY